MSLESEQRRRAAFYVRVVDGVDDHLLSDKAFRTLIRLAAWSAYWGLAGYVPAACLQGLVFGTKRAREGLVEELEHAGVFVREGTAYRIRHASLAFRRDDAEDWDRSEVAQVLARDGLWCRYCCAPVADGDLTIDHIVPRSQGGSDKPHNLVVACRSCNSRKGARTPAAAGMTLREPVAIS